MAFDCTEAEKPVNRHTVTIHKRLSDVWRVVQSNMKRMCGASDVRPSDPYRVFRLDVPTDDAVACNVGPVVFRLPERAKGGVPRLYIAVDGLLVLRVPVGNDGRLCITSFGTRVGYFRERDRTLEHVYGVHYDCAHQQVGHPVFHAQMDPQEGFVGIINEHYRQDLELRNHIDRVLKNVRSPTAEMDVFSVFVQICADHLVWEGSGTMATDAFGKIRDSCGSLGGVAEGIQEFQAALPCCYRSVRWYA